MKYLVISVPDGAHHFSIPHSLNHLCIELLISGYSDIPSSRKATLLHLLNYTLYLMAALKLGFSLEDLKCAATER